MIYFNIILLLIIIFISQNSAEKLNKLESNKINDIGFNLIEECEIKGLNDFMVIILILFYIFKGKNIKNIIKLSIVLLFFRIIFMNLTVLPETSDKCKTKKFLPFTGSCRDLVFSGHTALCVLIYINIDI